MKKNNAVAIIGMGCIFPRANGLKEFWRLLFNGQDAITEIPRGTHWALEDYFHEDPSFPDHTYCRRGGFIPEISFDPARYGMPPNNLDATDTSQLLGLTVAEMALQDAGYGEMSREIKDRTNVILGVTGTQELVISLGGRLGHPIWKKALEESGLPPEKRQEVVQRISEGYVQWQENSFPGLLGNVVAGRIANRLDLGGTNTVVDAACASSLSAIHTAIMELQSGRCDMSVTGGVDTLNDIFMHMCFSKTGVLSHTSDARPFSKDADGTVLGEGIGMLVLKRLKDAEKDHDRIYAVIQGMGTSSDGKTGGIYAPNAQGQIRALRDAYDRAGISPDSLGTMEAHGTGTRVGDKIEFSALKEFLPETSNSCALGSVKSMIGHSKASAGAAGLIKAVLGLHHKVVLPTLKAEEPDPELDINNSAFYLNNASKPWLNANGSPRVSGVSAFGFGGSNFHAVVQEYQTKKEHVSWDGSLQIAAFSSDTMDELIRKITAFKKEAAPGNDWDSREKSLSIAWHTQASRKNFKASHNQRLLILIREDENPAEKAAKALEFLKDENPAGKNGPDIFFGSGPARGKTAFLFPGQGSQYPGMGRDLIAIFPEAMETLDKAQTLFHEEWKDEQDHTLTDHIFPPPPHLRRKKEAEELLRKTDVAQPAIGAVSLAMARLLERFNIRPQAACGHSFGEIPALCLAGRLDETTCLSLAAARGKYMAQAPGGNGERGSMLAVLAPLTKIEELIREESLDLVLANRNSPSQGVLSGSDKEIDRAFKLCRGKKMRAVKLPVAAAFHSNLVEKAVAPFKERLQSVTLKESEIPVYANTTGRAYPQNPAEAGELLGNQLLNPVNFIQEIESMYLDGVRIFLEVGPKNVLAGLTKSILKGRDALIMAMDASTGKKPGIEDLGRVLCLLTAQGIDADLTAWENPVEQPGKKLMRIPLTGANIKPDTSGGLPPSPPMNTPDIPDKKTSPANPPTPEKQDIPKHQNRPKASQPTQGEAMTPPRPRTDTMSQFTDNNLPVSEKIPHPDMGMTPGIQLVQKGLETMQELQAQTARAHEKFLETQTAASQTLQRIMEQTQLLARGMGNQPLETQPAMQPPATAAPPRQEARAPQETYSTPPMPNPAPETTVPLQIQAAPEAPSYAQTIYPAGEPNVPVTPQVKESVPEAPQTLSIEQQAPENEEPGIAATITPEISAESAESREVMETLIKTVSRLTGFPEEMLEPGMDLESDLGIDSIKRVEIVSELEKKLPETEGVLTPDRLGELRTLKEIAEALGNQNPAGDAAPTATGTTDNHASGITPQAAPMPAAAMESREVMETLIKTVSRLTGFPEEMLESAMDLESDLGIDSIKRVEIVSELEKKLPETEGVLTPDRLGELRTLKEIAEALGSQKPADTSGTDAVEKNPRTAVVSAETLNVKTPESGTQDAPLIRREISLKRLTMDHVRFHNGSSVSLPQDKTVYITRENGGLSRRLAEEFKKQNITCREIPIKDALKQSLDDAAGLIIIAPALGKKQKSDHDFLCSAFLLAQKCAPALKQSADEKGAFFATISFLGGGFGFDDTPITDPVQGGLAGLAKTAALEWPDILCRSLDMPSSPETSLKLAGDAASLVLIHGSVEMGITRDACIIPELKPREAEPENEETISSRDVVVITGGAKGVTAACALEIAKKSAPAIALLGRSEYPFEEPEWLKGAREEGTMKQAIMKNGFAGKKPSPGELTLAYRRFAANREIRQNMEMMRRAGSTVSYHKVDVCSPKAVAATLKTVREQHGPIRGVIHGAGVLEDKLITDKSREQFQRVFDTKVKGLDNLLAATSKDPLKYMVLFSSIAARTGNQGQADYAMANEVLNKTAAQHSQNNPECRFIAVNWGPWEGGMVSPALKRKFTRRGVSLIPLKTGAQSLVREISSRGPVEVVMGGTLPGTASGGDDPTPTTTRKPFSSSMTLEAGTRACPILNDHCLAGEPVVPTALILEWYAHAFEHANPGLLFTGADDFMILKGIKPGKKDMKIQVRTGKGTPSDAGFRVEGDMVSPKEGDALFFHSVCSGLLAPNLPKAPVHTGLEQMELKPLDLTAEDAYDTILFHGKGLQGIRTIEGYSPKGIAVTARRAPQPEKWLEKPHRKRWIFDPLLLDAAFQAAIIWCFERTGRVCLPSRMGSLRIFDALHAARGDVRITLTVNEKTEAVIKGYFTFLDQEERVLASITGFEAVTDPSLIKAFKPEKSTTPNKEKAPVVEHHGEKIQSEPHDVSHGCMTPLYPREKILAFAVGNPSEAFGEPYRIFDQEREIARLPGPPYFFMDRVVKAEPDPWEMKAGGWIEAEFDLPRDGWYFRANRSATLPHCILLEIALQPCGWLAAYAGSALKSRERLHFRNLGGKATLVKPVTCDTGTLTMRARMTRVSEAGGLIIQDFEMEVLGQGECLFKGETNFGFFTRESLATQAGIKNPAISFVPTRGELDKARPLVFEADHPLSPDDTQDSRDTGMPAKALRMIDAIDIYLPKGGHYGKGYIKGSKKVDKDEWFFKAHFYQDPVCPGSLGIESFIQLMRFAAMDRFKTEPHDRFDVQMTAGQTHDWTYRGQIIPGNKKIEVEAHIKEIIQGETPGLTADGILSVDGLVIYQMEDFSISLAAESAGRIGRKTAASRQNAPAPGKKKKETQPF